MTIDYRAIFEPRRMTDFYVPIAHEIAEDPEEVQRLVDFIIENHSDLSYMPSWLFCHVFDYKNSILYPHVEAFTNFLSDASYASLILEIDCTFSNNLISNA